MKFTKIKRLLVGVFSFSVACTAMAQDLIAKQAPVDVQLRAVDSIAMLSLIFTSRGILQTHTVIHVQIFQIL